MYIQCKDNMLITETSVITEPAIIIDTETGTLLKYGNMSERLTAYLKRCHCANLPVKLIEFNQLDFTMDEICTIINYASNCHGENLLKLLNMTNKTDIQVTIKKWQNFGY